MWFKSLDLNKKRKRLLDKIPEGALHDYYETPFPAPKSKVSDISFVVLDFETTGLDIKYDHLVSVGLIEIDQLGVNLDSAWHEIIKTSRDLPEQSTVIHEITDDMVNLGEEVNLVFEKLLARLKGRVLIAHHAQIELGYLKKISRELYQQDFIIPVIDTQVLAKRQLQREQVTLEKNSLRLFNLRERYKLPAYKAHNALSDALSTAELFLALMADLYPGLDCRLKDLLTK